MTGQDPERISSMEKEADKMEPFESEGEEQEEGKDNRLPFPDRPPKVFTKEPHVDDEDDLDFVRGRQGSSSAFSCSSQHTDNSAHDAQLPPHRVRSRAQSSARSLQRQAVKVPRKQRRGLFARFSIIAEVTDAHDYPRRMKWTITTIVAIAAAAAPMGSSIVLPGLVDITRDLHTSAGIANLSVAMYMLSMSIFPLWWSTFSETLGRRTIYITSFALFAVVNVAAGLSVDITMFIIMRILSGGAAASVQAVGAGTIADVWDVHERGQAMSMFYLGPLCGPLISPILGGVFSETLGWRSSMYFLAIFGACLVLLILFCLPETLKQRKSVAAEAELEASAESALSIGEKIEDRPELTRVTTQQSIKIKSRKYLSMARRTLLDPLRIVLLLQFKSVAICVLYASVTFSSLYVLNISIQETFSEAPFNYNSIIVGLLYLPNSLGYFLSSSFSGRWVDRIMHREARKAGRYDEKGRLKFRPEDRMKENAWFGALLYPAALLVYGWTAQYKIIVAVPLIANFFFGVGSMIIFSLATTMLTEFMPRKASNGVALNNFIRNICAAVLVAVTEPLINALGNGWLFTIIALIALLSGCLTIWAMKQYGSHWRVSMDKKLDKVMGE